MMSIALCSPSFSQPRCKLQHLSLSSNPLFLTKRPPPPLSLLTKFRTRTFNLKVNSLHRNQGAKLRRGAENPQSESDTAAIHQLDKNKKLLDMVLLSLMAPQIINLAGIPKRPTYIKKTQSFDKPLNWVAFLFEYENHIEFWKKLFEVTVLQSCITLVFSLMVLQMLTLAGMPTKMTYIKNPIGDFVGLDASKAGLNEGIQGVREEAIMLTKEGNQGAERPQNESDTPAIHQLDKKLPDMVILSPMMQQIINLTGYIKKTEIYDKALNWAASHFQYEDLIELSKKLFTMYTPAKGRWSWIRVLLLDVVPQILTLAGITNKMTYIKNPTESFADLVGLAASKADLNEIVQTIRGDGISKELMISLPKGVLLYGSKGTGKKSLTKATAGEAGVPFFSIPANHLADASRGAAYVRKLLHGARANKPCIFLISEIEDICGPALKELLEQMKRWGKNEGVLVVATANSIDKLDTALTDSSGFFELISVKKPNKGDRKSMFAKHMGKAPMEESESISKFVAEQTEGLGWDDVGAIANKCKRQLMVRIQECKQEAVGTGGEFVSMDDAEKAVAWFFTKKNVLDKTAQEGKQK